MVMCVRGLPPERGSVLYSVYEVGTYARDLFANRRESLLSLYLCLPPLVPYSPSPSFLLQRQFLVFLSGSPLGGVGSVAWIRLNSQKQHLHISVTPSPFGNSVPSPEPLLRVLEALLQWRLQNVQLLLSAQVCSVTVTNYQILSECFFGAPTKCRRHLSVAPFRWCVSHSAQIYRTLRSAFSRPKRRKIASSIPYFTSHERGARGSAKYLESSVFIWSIHRWNWNLSCLGKIPPLSEVKNLCTCSNATI